MKALRCIGAAKIIALGHGQHQIAASFLKIEQASSLYHDTAHQVDRQNLIDLDQVFIEYPLFAFEPQTLFPGSDAP